MIPLFLFILAVIFSIGHLFISKHPHNRTEAFLSYLIFFNIGIMGLLAFYAHIFMPDEIAKGIGWTPGSPFQYEIGAVNLAFGVLGVLSLWLRGLFWVATVLGNSIFLLGAFVVHLIQYSHGDTAPLNSGFFVWFGDLILPILYLGLLACYLWNQRSSLILKK